MRGRAAFGDPLSHGPDGAEDALGLDDGEVDGVSLSETEEGETHSDGGQDVDPQPPAAQNTSEEQGAVVLEFPAATDPAGGPATGAQNVTPLPTPTEQTVKRITDAATKLGEVSANAITLLGAVLLERDAAEKGSFPIADEEAVSDLIHHLELVAQAGWSGSRLEDVLERAFTRDATPVERRQAFLTQLALNPNDPAAA